MAKKQTPVLKAADMTEAELAASAGQLRRQIEKARLDILSGKLKNTRAVFMLCKQLARGLTWLRQKRALHELKSGV